MTIAYGGSYGTLAQLKGRLPQGSQYKEQRVKLTGSPAGGTFTLDYNGSATAAIAYNATAATVQLALEAVGSIGAGNVAVSGPRGGDWAVDFATDIAVAPLALGTNSLTGGSSPSVQVRLLMQELLDAAAETLDGEIGHGWGTAAASASTRTVYGSGTDILTLPAHVADSVTTVAYNATAITSYVQLGGALYFTYGTPAGYSYPLPPRYGAWAYGRPYVVTARWGWGDAPADVVEANLQLAVRAYRSRDAGYSDVIGVAGEGEVAYTRAYPADVKRTIDRYRLSGTPMRIV